MEVFDVSVNGRSPQFCKSRWAALLAAAGAMVAAGAALALPEGPAPQLVSRASGTGAAANAPALAPSISGSGRFITFSSSATNLVPAAKRKRLSRTYLRDLRTGTTRLLGDFSASAAVAASGNVAAFQLGAGDLSAPEVYIYSSAERRSRPLGSLLPTLPPSGETSGHRVFGSISADGTRVAFLSDDPGPAFNVYVADLKSGTVTALTGPRSQAASSDQAASRPLISGDGRYVVFTSGSSDLVPGDTNGQADAFRADVSTGAIVLVDRARDGGVAQRGAQAAAISGDGRIAAFASRDSNLDAAAHDGTQQLFVRDMVADTITLVSRATGAAGAAVAGDVSASSISSDGQLVAFAARAPRLAAGGCRGSNVFIRDITRETTELAVGRAGAARNCAALTPVLSGGGRWLAFGLKPGRGSHMGPEEIYRVAVRR
jgi:Tol biopolymer transport system component